jgi:hypothetical protein
MKQRGEVSSNSSGPLALLSAGFRKSCPPITPSSAPEKTESVGYRNAVFHCPLRLFVSLQSARLRRGSRRRRSTPVLREAFRTILTTVNSDFDWSPTCFLLLAVLPAGPADCRGTLTEPRHEPSGCARGGVTSLCTIWLQAEKECHTAFLR